MTSTAFNPLRRSSLEQIHPGTLAWRGYAGIILLLCLGLSIVAVAPRPAGASTTALSASACAYDGLAGSRLNSQDEAGPGAVRAVAPGFGPGTAEGPERLTRSSSRSSGPHFATNSAGLADDAAGWRSDPMPPTSSGTRRVTCSRTRWLTVR